MARLTRRPGLVRGIGGFGGLFSLKKLGYKDPVLVASADGVGTKLRIAHREKWYMPLGIDLVAMNVNDILCTGAEPLFFLDYVAAAKLDPEVLVEIVRGIVRGCMESHCVLLGGETAQMGLLYRRGEFDLAGFAVGAVERKELITGDRIRTGDSVIGLASNGLHANGFSLVQKVLSAAEQKKLAQELLKPTRIYVRPVRDLLHRKVPIRGIAHITGGSFREKVARILPDSVAVRLDKRSWVVPPIFRKIQSAGVTEEEMYRTFNMGIGLTLIVPPRAVSQTRRWLNRHAVKSWVIGEVVRGRRGVALV